MGKNLGYRYKHIHLWSIDFSRRLPRQFSVERILFSTNGTEITEKSHAKEEFVPQPHNIYKI